MIRLVAVAMLLTAALTLGCQDGPTEVTEGTSALFKKGGSPGKPGGGGEDPGPVEVTVLFDHYSRTRGLSYSIHGMDRSGSYKLLLDEGDEYEVGSIGPRWASDGIHFVYEREIHGAGLSEIVVGNIDGTITPVFSGPWGLKPDWSPLPLADGYERIAFTQNEDLYVMKLDGSDVQQLTTGYGIGQVIWSRDASQLLATVRDPQLDPEGSHLELLDVTCDGSTSLPACRVTGSTSLDLSSSGITEYDFWGSMDWAHNSDRVLVQYIGRGYDGLRELGILDLTGTPTFAFVTDNPGGQAYNGAWSWDDSEVVYVKWPIGKRSKAGIMIRDVATGAETQIFDGDASFGMDWRPTPPSGN